MTMTGRSLVAGALALALTACGGDETVPGPRIGYTGEKTLVTVDESNAQQLAAQASASGGGFVSGDYGLGYLKTGAAMPRADHRAALALLKKYRARPSVALTGVTGSADEACTVSGHATVSVRFADPSGETISSGDYFQVTFYACDEGDGFTLTGILKLTFTGTDGLDPTYDPAMLTDDYEYGFQITMTHFAITENATGIYSGTNGDIKYTTVWDDDTFTLTQEISGASIANEVGTADAVLESSLLAPVPGTSKYSMYSQQVFTDASAWSLVSDAWGMSARVCSLELQGCLDLEVDPPFVQDTGAVSPKSGTMRVTGASGAYVQVQATNADGSVTVTYDVDGAGSTEPFTLNTTWDCLSNPGSCT